MRGMQPAAGSLLIASATLLDPNFARCVLLILNSDSDGTLGVVLNRPTETPVGEVLSTWQDMTSEPGVFFRGGPVELNAALALGSLRTGAGTVRLAPTDRLTRDRGPRHARRTSSWAG